jgi:hypothetical protein
MRKARNAGFFKGVPSVAGPMAAKLFQFTITSLPLTPREPMWA